jgi:hypothetical protein
LNDFLIIARTGIYKLYSQSSISRLVVDHLSLNFVSSEVRKIAKGLNLKAQDFIMTLIKQGLSPSKDCSILDELISTALEFEVYFF